MINNEMKVVFKAIRENESFARLVIIGFIAPLDPNSQELNEIKTIVSEGVTNAIIHGYERKDEKIRIHCVLEGQVLYIEIEDYGKGIENIKEAMQPLFTTKPELERSGMGFSFMEAFMDTISVESEVGKGTVIKMRKEIGKGRDLWNTQSL